MNVLKEVCIEKVNTRESRRRT
uniref:Uncharacterized protein n=1 Tax=Arundo donax TaxID=35708 RepID=A0A0A9G6F9_ARUDO